jgi:serine/threonine protein kinase
VELLPSDEPPAQTLSFAVGETPPNFPNWTFVEQLPNEGACQVWVCQQKQTGARQRLKITADPRTIPSLRREVDVCRELSLKGGVRDEWLLVHDENLSRPPYFYVAHRYAGSGLKTWIERRGGITAIPLNERIEIVCQVAEALAHAHAQLVLHGNLTHAAVHVEELGAGRWRARLAGFGSQNDDPICRAYHAPELTTGEPATASSDIYALGMLLFHILTGHWNAPIATGWETLIDDELLRDDIAASTLGRSDKRLPSAQELAQRLRVLDTRREDLQRRRAAEVAQAKWERSRQRMPWIVTLALVTVVAAIAVTYVISRSVARQRATKELNAYITQNVDMLDDPVYWVGAPAMSFKDSPIRSLPVGQATLTLDLERAAIPSRDSSANDTAALSAQVDVAKDLLLLNRPVEAEERLNVILPMVDKADDATHYMMNANVEFCRALLARELGRPNDAVAPFTHLAQLGVNPDNNPDFARRIDFRLDEALFANGNYADAEHVERQLLKAVAEQYGPDGLVVNVTLSRLGATLTVENRYNEAEATLQKAENFFASQWRADDPATIDERHALAYLYERRGQWQEAIGLRQTIVASVQQLTGKQSEYTVRALTMLARDLMHANRTAEALTIVVQATEIASNSVSPKAPGGWAARATLAEILYNLSHPREAAPVIEELVPVSGTEQPTDVGLEGLIDYVNAIHYRNDLHQIERAKELAKRAQAVFERKFGVDDPDTKAITEYLKSFPA